MAAIKALEIADPSAIPVLKKALAGNGYVVALAADRIAEGNLHALVPDLAEAFERLCTDGVKRDPQCKGKIAIARVLHAMDFWDDRVFVRGLTITQPEGWGEHRDDTAAPLRGMCGVAHAQHARHDALDVLADLLHDPEAATRVLAATGLGDSGRPDATALLRYKVVEGDAEAEVLSACFESLFALAREASTVFALRFLDAHDDRAEMAVIALGTARIADAIDPIITWNMGCKPSRRHAIGFLALAMMRNDRATDYLIERVEGEGADAVGAAKALSTFAHDASIADRVRTAARGRREITSLF